MSTLGERLQKLRREKNWSQEKLAQEIGIVRRLISRYETGVSTPSVETLRKLAAVFGVSVDFLLKDPVESQSTTKIDDNELLGYIAEIQKMNSLDKMVLKTLIQAMILKSKFSDKNIAD